MTWSDRPTDPAGRAAESLRKFGISIALCLLAVPATRAAIPPDLPMVQRLGSGVSALGMGGASTAVADDFSALATNPAGLAQLRSTEFGGGFESRSLDVTTRYFGQGATTPLEKSGIEAAGFAHPFPTWRGSFVIGFSYDREATFDQDYYRSGSGPGVEFEEERIFEDGTLGAWRAGFGITMTPELMLGVGATLLTGDSRREREFQFQEEGGTDREFTSTVTDLDLTAVSASLGALYRAPAGWRVGFTLHLPEGYDLDGRQTEDVRRYQVTGDTLDYYDDFRFEDSVTLPFRTSLGLSYAPPGALDGLLLSLQWDYADWQQIDYDGPIRSDDRRYAYRQTHDLRVGARYAPPNFPIQLRAGYISQPVAYRLIATDVFMGEARAARFDPDRRYFTAGIGIELDPTFTLDLAYLHGGFERSDDGGSGAGAARATTEEYKDRRVLFGASFRLPATL